MLRTQLFRAFLVLLFVLGFGLAPSHAQTWSGIISPGRATDWSQAGIPGGIPNRTTICATLNPGASGTQIDSAIQSCPSGQVVYLNAGTYNISDQGIDFANTSDVTLRGAGADKTFLVTSASTGCYGQTAFICLENGEANWNGAPANTANWTAGYTAGTTVITLSSTSNLAPGSVIWLDQQDENTDNGNIFDCQFTAAPCYLQETGGGMGRGGNHARQEPHVVTAINGSNLTISPSLLLSYQTSQGPGAWWATTNIGMSGVEDLSIDASNLNALYVITLMNTTHCWVKGVRIVNAQRSGINLYLTFGSVVENNYFYGTQNSASESYGVQFLGTGFDLIQNNIFQKVASPLQAAQGIGVVWGYNFNLNDYFTTSPDWMIYGQSFHDSGNYYYLAEGNQGNGLVADNTHGHSYLITGFRNWWLGFDYNNGTPDALETIPVQIFNYSRYFNFVGNVLGQPGYHQYYQNLCGNSAAPYPQSIQAIWAAGWTSNNGGGSSCPDESVGDPLTTTSLMRWGNWDVVSGSVHWSTSEVPTGDPNFPNAVPSSQALPASFYLPGKPTWWGSMPYPAIGPDVTGGNSSFAGHVYNIPAANCFFSAMGGPTNGVSSALTFNEATCYGAGSSAAPPAPPTNLTAVAH